MRSPTRHNAALSLSALIAGVVALCVLAGTALALSPLPRSDYTVRAACPAPTPGHASCMALQLVPQSAAAVAHAQPLAAGSHAGQPAPPAPRPASAASEGAFGLTPADLHAAYRLPNDTSGTQTIALVDAYNDPTAESDLKTYSRQLGLPACTTANGCFEKVNQKGETANLPFPRTVAELEGAEAKEAEEAEGWGGEISLDIETAHATCQNCKILLVEANTPGFEDLEAAERAAETLGATEISNSWGGPELGETTEAEAASPFNHPKTVITASAGDDGYLEWAASPSLGEASFPATSPHVIAVGGTRLLTTAGGVWQSETVWNDEGEIEGVPKGYGAGGGGCSSIFGAQPWQSAVTDWPEVGCGTKRAVSDISADADPYTGVAVFYTSRECESRYQEQTVHWCTYGGTSLASPIIASTYALAGGAQGVSYPSKTVYENATARPGARRDVVSGSNGTCTKPFNENTGASGCTIHEEGKACAQMAICLARSGFDGPSGVGTPHGLNLFLLSGEAELSEAEAESKEQPERAEEATRREAAIHEEEVERTEELKHTEELKRAEELQRAEEAKRREEESKAHESGPPVLGGYTPPPAPVAPLTVPVPATVSEPVVPQISALALTLRALIALDTGRPRVRQVAFAFNLNATAKVRITLAKRVRVRGHTRWQTMGRSLTITARAGRTSGHLGGHDVLAPGVYRLTATPAHGAARSVPFQIG